MTVIRRKITSRQAWLEMRRLNIGASDIGALFGAHPFKTEYGLYAERAGLVPDIGPSSEILERGQVLEHAMPQAVRLKRPDWRIEKCEDYLSAPQWLLGATPDFLVWCPQRQDVGILQTKIVAYREFEKHWQDGPPLAYVLQTVQELMLDATNRNAVQAWGAIAVMALSDYRMHVEVYEFERNTDAELRIIKAAREFWAAVARREAPRPDYARDSGIIRAVNATGGGEPVDLTRHNRIAMLCEEKIAWARRAGNAERALETIDAEIADILGEAEKAVHPEFNITRKAQWFGGHTVPRQQTRVLRITRKHKKAADEVADDEVAA